MKNADMPAMPVVDPDEGYPLDVSKYGSGLSTGKFASGLTKRETMAMHMMAGMLSSGTNDCAELCKIAKSSVAYADILLAELEKQQ